MLQLSAFKSFTRVAYESFRSDKMATGPVMKWITAVIVGCLLISVLQLGVETDYTFTDELSINISFVSHYTTLV